MNLVQTRVFSGGQIKRGLFDWGHLDTEIDMGRGKLMYSFENTVYKPKNAWGFQKLGERIDPASQPSQGTNTDDTLISDFQPPEMWSN